MSADSTPIPNTLSQIQRSSAHSDLQPISADYYNLTNASGAPVAGLLVLMDRRHRPVRAELHLYDGTVGPLQEMAERQAHLLIGDRYPGQQSLPLDILRAELEEERRLVPMAPPPPPPRVPAWVQPVGLRVAAVLAIALVGWLLNDLLTPDRPVAENPAALVSAEGAEEGGAVATETAGIGDGVRIFEQNGLPASRNARPLDVGQRVRIIQGYEVAMRTEAGASAGEVIGSMVGGDEATIVNGPIWLPGNSDTIVWWYVQRDDGTRAWIAANTSELTLLEAVP